MPQTTTSAQIVLNKMTKAQFDATTKDPGQFYFVTDDDQFLPGTIKYGKFIDLGLDSTSLVVTLKDQDNTALSSKSLNLNSLGFLTNTATGTNSITINGVATTVLNSAINIGASSKVTGNGGVAIGYSSKVDNGVCIGKSSEATWSHCTAIGNSAQAVASYAIQIGYGTNSEASSFYVATSISNNWKMLGSDGLIPDARLSSNIARTSAIPTTVAELSDATNYVTTNTQQDINSIKTFIGNKTVKFKQSGSSDKLGFTLYTRLNVEAGYLEYNPSNKIDGAPLMTLGNYATANGGITNIGFRRYCTVTNKEGAYNLLAPLTEFAKTPFNLTTTYTTFYLPLGFTDGNTMLTTAKSGVVDLSSILPSVATSSTAGLVKPDGTTVTVDANGVISAQSGQQYAMVITDYTAS